MTHKELIEQVKKDCQHLKRINEEQANHSSSLSLALTSVAAAYQTVINLIEVYQNNKTLSDTEETLDKLAQDECLKMLNDNICHADDIFEFYKAGYKKAKED